MLLAVDAGGTSTRAVVLDGTGLVFGYGRASGGNPTAVGITEAVAAIGEAAALAAAGPRRDPERLEIATIAMAGEKSERFAEQVTERLTSLGWRQVILQHDLLGIFCSGTHRPDGYALIAGTGSVAARIIDGRLDRVVGGRGWLLGDAGSGFWIGHRVAQAVIAALDGQQPPTALTPLVLRAMGLEADLELPIGREQALRQLVSTFYAGRPVELAALAPLAFAVHEDPTARAILLGAAHALADLLAAVQIPDLAGPVVAGGSVLVHGLLAAPADLRPALVPIGRGVELIPVPDGLVGAAVLSLRGIGIAVDEVTFELVQSEVERCRESVRE